MAPGDDLPADNPALKAIGRFLSVAIIVAAIVAIVFVTRLYYSIRAPTTPTSAPI